MKEKKSLTEEQIDRVIEMAWEDRTPLMRYSFNSDLKNKRSLN